MIFQQFDGINAIIVRLSVKSCHAQCSSKSLVALPCLLQCPTITTDFEAPSSLRLMYACMAQFYAPILFESLATGSLGGLLNTVIINAVNVLATFIAIGFVDRWGRRALLIGTAAWMLVMQVLVAIVLAIEFGKYGTFPLTPRPTGLAD